VTHGQNQPVSHSVIHPKTGKFPKSERLCSRKDIEFLFEKGKSLHVYPLRCTYIIDYETSRGDRIMVIVSKRNHKGAVTRNLFKRRIREAYRRNRHLLTRENEQPKPSMTLAISYISKQKHSYVEIENAIQEIFQKLSDISAGSAR